MTSVIVSFDTGVGPALGEPVLFTAKYVRVKSFGFHVWRPEGCPQKRGVLVGLRVLTNGKMTYYEGPYEAQYTATHSLQTALVAYDLRKKPVYVPLSNLTYERW